MVLYAYFCFLGKCDIVFRVNSTTSEILLIINDTEW